MRINVHIERLVLDGLPVTSAQGAIVQGAVEQELARLLATGGLSDDLCAGGIERQRRAGILLLSGRERPMALGRGIARAVHGGLGTPVQKEWPRNSRSDPMSHGRERTR